MRYPLATVRVLALIYAHALGLKLAGVPVHPRPQAARTTRPTIAVLASFDPALLQAEATALRRLAKRAPLLLSGPGASDTLSTQLGARRLNGDLITAANEVAGRSNG